MVKGVHFTTLEGAIPITEYLDGTPKVEFAHLQSLAQQFCLLEAGPVLEQADVTPGLLYAVINIVALFALKMMCLTFKNLK